MEGLAIRRFNALASLIFIAILATGWAIAWSLYSGTADTGTTMAIIIATFIIAAIVASAIKWLINGEKQWYCDCVNFMYSGGRDCFSLFQ